VAFTEKDYAAALEHANKFIARVIALRGPNLRIWQKPGIGTRVYFPMKLGFISFSPGGDITEFNRGYQTLEFESLYPQWRRAYLQAKAEHIARVTDSIEERA
jgi:hypothetical protein